MQLNVMRVYEKHVFCFFFTVLVDNVRGWLSQSYCFCFSFFFGASLAPPASDALKFRA